MPQNTNPSRHLRPEEIALIAGMLESHPLKSKFSMQSSDYYVQDIDDGGMGSIQFLSLSQTKRKFGMRIAEVEYTDQDGVLVLVSIITDEQGELYEIDFWKVDFSPLIHYPSPNQLRITG
jgi:hypothetical protein